MLSRDKRKEYDKMASDVANGRAGYRPAKKSRYSKSAPDKYGSAPRFL